MDGVVYSLEIRARWNVCQNKEARRHISFDCDLATEPINLSSKEMQILGNSSFSVITCHTLSNFLWDNWLQTDMRLIPWETWSSISTYLHFMHLLSKKYRSYKVNRQIFTTRVFRFAHLSYGLYFQRTTKNTGCLS